MGRAVVELQLRQARPAHRRDDGQPDELELRVHARQRRQHHPASPRGYAGQAALTRSVGPGGWSSFTPNALNQRTSGTGAPTYDANGNVTDDYQQYKQKFDAENRMVEADFHTSAGSSTVTGQETQFAYDGLGRRIIETEINTGGTVSYILRHLWCGNEICQTRYWNGSTETVTARLYPEGEDSIGVGKYANMPDQLGSVRDFVDVIGGTVVFSLDFGPEGEQLRWNGSTWPTRRYAAQYNRGPLNSNLTRFRNYNANLISWNSRDPIGEAGGLNLHGFVGGNPVNRVDPDGRFWFLIGTALGAIGGYEATHTLKGAAIGAAAGTAAGVFAPEFAEAVGGGVAGAAMIPAVNVTAAAVGTMADNKVEGKPLLQDVGRNAIIAGAVPVVTGEAVVTGGILAAAKNVVASGLEAERARAMFAINSFTLAVLPDLSSSVNQSQAGGTCPISK